MKTQIDLKIIGIILIGISITSFITTFYLNEKIRKLMVGLHVECPLPPDICPAKGGWFFSMESIINFIIASILGAFGAFLIVTSIRIEKLLAIKTMKLKRAIKSLKNDEKRIYNIIVSSDGSVLQGDLVRKTGYSKVKVSRILDRLEAKGIVERRRRGMVNVVILKQ